MKQLSLFSYLPSTNTTTSKLTNVTHYMLPSELVMLSLPIHKLKKNTYTIANQAGVTLDLRAKNNCDLPSGKYARLLLQYLITYLHIKNHKRRKDELLVNTLTIPSITKLKDILGVTGNSSDSELKKQLYNLLNTEITICSSRGNYKFIIAHNIKQVGYNIEIAFSDEFIDYIQSTSLIKIECIKDLNKLKSRCIDLLILTKYKALQSLIRLGKLTASKLKMLYLQSGLLSSFWYFKQTFFKMLKNEHFYVLFCEPL